jgi:hypothetical protein
MNTAGLLGAMLLAGCGTVHADSAAAPGRPPALTVGAADTDAARTASAPSATTPPQARCPPSHSHVILRNSHAAVYDLHHDGILACSAHESFVSLTDGALGLPPLMDLNGIVVGFVGGDEESDIIVGAVALRPDDKGFQYSTNVPRPMRYGSLRVSRRGSIAWIGCPLAAQHAFPRNGKPPSVSSEPNCIKPGRSVDTVYLVRPDHSDAKKLDSGAQMDPRSLRRKGNTLTWVRAGVRHSARMP